MPKPITIEDLQQLARDLRTEADHTEAEAEAMLDAEGYAKLRMYGKGNGLLQAAVRVLEFTLARQ